MPIQSATNGAFTLKAYPGDAKTLLAFNLQKKDTKNLAGFTIQCKPAGRKAYSIDNTLQFETPANHAQDPKEKPTASINAPIHKFRWLHVPGSSHQGTTPFAGNDTYTVTPRYFDKTGSLQPLDASLSASVTRKVVPLAKAGLQLGFTRGFTQSQAFVRHFSKTAPFSPKGRALLFDTSQQAAVNSKNQPFTFQDEYAWSGFTARDRIFEILNQVKNDGSLRLDVFACDLNKPGVCRLLLDLAKAGRVRIILDDAALHHDTAKPKPEDEFEKLFIQAAGNADSILRGHFGRYAHDKVLIVSQRETALRVLTGSTNFSVTGMYVNSNHVLVFNDPDVAARYAELFNEAFRLETDAPSFRKLPLATQPFLFSTQKTPATTVTFAPHPNTFTKTVLSTITTAVSNESTRGKGASVFFAVMEMKTGTGPVFPALQSIHANPAVFSFGISDNPDGIELYKPGKPTGDRLPPPFNQVPNIGIGHQIHHKFVVCGFNGPNPVVFCGSSNLAEGGENSNGDNLIEIHDADTATAFTIEAVGLVDHFIFLDRLAAAPKAPADAKENAPAPKSEAAATAGWFLGTSSKWVDPYLDPNDLKCRDRELFC